ncbi:MAG: hypothetical protein QNK60_02470 [Flavobacteriales bacterium]
MKKSLSYLLIFSIFLSCSTEQEESYLASYKEDYLTIEKVMLEMPDNVSDSASYVSEYVNKWLRDKVVVNKAKLYIDEQEVSLLESVEKYKNNLLIYRYQKELIDNQFDTTVNKSDIQSYYKEYITDFILHKNIIKARLIVLDKDALSKVKIERLISAKGNENLNELIDICEMYAVNYFLNDSAWVYFSEFSHKLPLSERESIKILSRTNKTYSFTDDNFVYILFVKDYQIKGSNSPLTFVFNNIRSLLQNKNKIKFINDIEDKLYQEAISSGNIKIY